MILEPNPNLFPKNGRSFTDLDKTVHRGGTWKEVIETVRRYRSRNRMPQGNIQREVFDQFCQRNPPLCRQVDNVDVPVKRKAATFKNRVLARLAELIQLRRLNDRPQVEEAEAERRAKICAGCPKNRSLDMGCTSCNTTLANTRKALLGKRRSRHTKLGFCSVLDEDLSVTVYLDLEPEADEALPEHCWRKKR